MVAEQRIVRLVCCGLKHPSNSEYFLHLHQTIALAEDEQIELTNESLELKCGLQVLEQPSWRSKGHRWSTPICGEHTSAAPRRMAVKEEMAKVSAQFLVHHIGILRTRRAGLGASAKMS